MVILIKNQWQIRNLHVQINNFNPIGWILDRFELKLLATKNDAAIRNTLWFLFGLQRSPKLGETVFFFYKKTSIIVEMVSLTEKPMTDSNLRIWIKSRHIKFESEWINFRFWRLWRMKMQLHRWAKKIFLFLFLGTTVWIETTCLWYLLRVGVWGRFS